MKPMTRRLPSDVSRRPVIVTLAALPVLAVARARAEPAPSEFIRSVGKETVEILQRDGATDAQRIDALVDVLNRATDLPLVARLVLGPYWRQASEQQRADYIELFRDLVVKTMADRLGSYGGETFEISGERAVDERDTLVATRISRPAQGNAPINVDWRVRNAGGRLAIIDIVAEGVSMVVTQRSEVGSVVAQKGLDGLIADLRQRLAGRA